MWVLEWVRTRSERLGGRGGPDRYAMGGPGLC
jgi:hypothetical protein